MVCEAVVARNLVKTSMAVKRAALNAWRQVVEVVLTACPEDLLSEEMRQNVIFELLHELLLKVGVFVISFPLFRIRMMELLQRYDTCVTLASYKAYIFLIC